MLPLASRITAGQWMLLAQPCATLPAVLVAAAWRLGADRCRRVDAEQQDQQRGHQRATAHTRHANQKADTESRHHIERIDHELNKFSASVR
jgi:hypothetical protein